MKDTRLNCRIGKQIKNEAMKKATKEGHNITGVVEQLLIQYVNGQVIPYPTSVTPSN
jgi:antitoxin component of RelBE/YafQ-DinJ toxin-antitoxin module